MQRSKLFFRFLLLILVLFSVGTFILCLTPPVSRDALTHHLYVPKLYINNLSFFEIPYIAFSYYPQLIDLLYCIPLYFKNDIIPKIIHFSFSIITSVFIYKYLKQKSDKLFALAGALFFLSIPVILKLSITVYVDLGLVCFNFISVYYLFKWKDYRFKWKYLIIAGVFTGLTLSVKYNGLISLLILTLTLPFLVPVNKRKNIKTFFYPFLFALTAVIVFSPWAIKNYIWTENPMYPLFGSYFTSQAEVTEDITPLDKDFYFGKGTNHFVLRKIVYNETLFETLTIPLRIFFQGEDDNPKYFDGKLNVFLLIFPFLYFFFRRNMDKNIVKDIDFLLIFSVLTILIVYFKNDMRIRYIVPVVPPLTIISFVTLYEIKKFLHKKKIKNYIKVLLLAGLFVSPFISNVSYFIDQFKSVKPFDYISGSVSRSDYISRFRPEYKLIEYLNNNSKNDSKVLALFLGRRGYYFDRDVRFRRDIFFYFIESSKNSSEVLEKLKNHKFDYIILRYDLFNNAVNNDLTESNKVLLMSFFDNCVTLLKKNKMYGSYKLK